VSIQIFFSSVLPAIQRGSRLKFLHL
jgi:hypothetical protein